jgi:PAS domain S-box-containing protein
MAASTERSDGRLRALSETMRAFAEATTDYGRLLETVCDHLARLIGDGCSLALLSEDQRSLSVAAVHFRDPALTAAARKVLGGRVLPVNGAGLGARVIATRRGLLLPHVDLPALAREVSPATVEIIEAMGIRSLLSVPLELRDRVLGVLTLMRVGSDVVPFNEDDEAVARTLAEHAALAISNAQLLQSLQRELEERMRAQQEASRFVALIQHSDELIAMADVDGRVLFVNEGGRRLVGLDPTEDVTQLRLTDFHADDGVKPAEMVRQHGRWRGQGRLRHFRTGALIDTQVSWFVVRDAGGFPVCFATVQHDVRETKLLEAQLKQAQKMEAIGTLAGGIAHDFNNILGAIMGNVELAQMALGPNHPIHDELQEISQAGRRATRLIRQILAFSRRRETTKRVVGLGEVIEEVTSLLRCSLSANVELVIAIDASAPNILADATQIHQILLNLCTNAWQALEGAPGRIQVNLDALTTDGRARAAGGIPLPAARYARLVVSDNGAGMPESTIERIFDPFFTTKAPGVGTGLGLSVVHGIVKDHGGTITVTSSPGRGAIFEILFPAHAAEADEPELEAPELPRGHGQHLLFLDDEEALVRLATRLLERLGYRVSGFVRADAALDAMRGAPRKFDLAITDFNMPDLSGLQFAKLVATIRPELPVILASGNLSDDIRDSAVRAGIRCVMQKPSTAAELAHTVHNILYP